MDMSFGLSGSRRSDEAYWPGRAGQVSPESGPLHPISGQRSGVVAPDWLDRLLAFLRREHPVKTAEAVADRCRGNVTAESVRKWFTRRSKPSSDALIWLATAYGPPLMVALYGPSPIGRPGWLETALRALRVEEMEVRLAELREDLEAIERR